MMDIKAFIIYNYFDFIQQRPTIGGIQTYLTDLMRILAALHIDPIICQPGECDLSIQMQYFEARQIQCSDTATLISIIRKDADLNKDLLIYGTDTLIVPNDGFHRSIAIQHGVFWDIPKQTHHSVLRYIGATAVQTYRTIKRINRVKRLVCVDYNFQNWYRTQVDAERTKLTVIPNYTHIAPVLSKSKSEINIIFARRFFPYRGTRVFISAIKRVLSEKEHVNVTIAGSGPDEKWMMDELSGMSNVVFTKYKSSDSLLIHADKHIAVVPTVGSEGTSLSLLEAMSAQCAVIASDVGGITNILIDDYNGLIVKAGDADQLFRSISFLIDNPIKRQVLSLNGYETVKQGFSYEHWQRRWTELINQMIQS